jgi:hypothetical protein
MSTVRTVPTKERIYNQKPNPQDSRNEEDYLSPEKFKKEMRKRIKAIFRNKK